jgi:hypothetical protein
MEIFKYGDHKKNPGATAIAPGNEHKEKWNYFTG